MQETKGRRARQSQHVISPLEGEMAAKRPEGVVSHRSPALFSSRKNAGASRAATPSVAFGDISPSRGEIVPPPRRQLLAKRTWLRYRVCDPSRRGEPCPSFPTPRR
ncbi:hypothetical protein EJ070_09705 [Mesorhizobium sp. M1E.F.Ca.ET.045.02.1.1]|nr:hypothetical protein EJ070_09705 [Mesorhizobium sp. M1E.F.Ca.ET.045.02.1.1]RUW79455.1 hypothetical protein EOA29_24085 [Mesorhizobium sp. M1E.F.Ca.ET.063.01.1.1]RWD79037.1 MAG: hypothetical protein EOS38_32475 [Mesorhizobium sp.]